MPRKRIKPEPAEAIQLGQEMLGIERRTLRADQSMLSGTLALLGTALQTSKSGEAEPLLRECLAIRQQKEANAKKESNTVSLLPCATKR